MECSWMAHQFRRVRGSRPGSMRSAPVLVRMGQQSVQHVLTSVSPAHQMPPVYELLEVMCACAGHDIRIAWQSGSRNDPAAAAARITF